MTKSNVMRVATLPGFPDNQDKVFEYTVAAAKNRLTYPGIQQCLSVTGVRPAGLLGAHVSPGASKEEIAETFKILTKLGGKFYPTWYVVGNFEQHFTYSGVGWNTALSIAGAMRENLGQGLTYYFLDTTTISKDYSFGIDIRATRAGSGSGVDFAYAKAGGSAMKPFTQIPYEFIRG